MMNDNTSAACSLLGRIFSDEFTDAELNSSPAAAATATNVSLPASAVNPALDRLKVTITSLVIPAFCGLGVIGNVMTIVILSQRRITTAMSCRIKRASRAGLVGLAVADLLCCITALAVTYSRDDDAAAYSEQRRVQLLAAVYGPFVQRTKRPCLPDSNPSHNERPPNDDILSETSGQSYSLISAVIQLCSFVRGPFVQRKAILSS